MDELRRIILDKQLEAAGLPEELRREAQLNVALGGLRISSGPEPNRSSMLASALAQLDNHREKNMHPITRLFRGRPWPARIALAAACLLALVLAAQLPFRTSYAQSAGRAVVFDLGTASSDSEASAKRSQWLRQSALILKAFHAISSSAHHVSVLSSPLDDNLMSLSGVIYVMDGDSGLSTAGEGELEITEDPEAVMERMSRLQKEMELLAGGIDEESRQRLAQARDELSRANAILLDLAGSDGDRLAEASRLLERQLQQLDARNADSKQLSELQTRLAQIRDELTRVEAARDADKSAARAELENYLKQGSALSAAEAEQLALELSGARQALSKEQLELLEKELAGIREPLTEEQRRQLEQELSGLPQELSAEMKQQLKDELAGVRTALTKDQRELLQQELAGITTAIDPKLRKQLDLELALTSGNLASAEKARNLAIEELRSQEQRLSQIDMVELKAQLAGAQDQLLELELVGPDGQPRLAELELAKELNALQENLELDRKALEELDLAGTRADLQQLSEIKLALERLALPEGELLSLTLLGQPQGSATEMLSFRFQDHLFSFAKGSSPQAMAKLVNRWLADNGHDCKVSVELCYDECGEVCGARAVPKE